MQGSSFVEDINNRFSATMTNVVRFRDAEAPDMKEITSSTNIQASDPCRRPMPPLTDW